jgi:hypothetical protein
LFDVDRNQSSETNHLIFKNESYIHQHVSSPCKWNNCNGYGKSIPWKRSWQTEELPDTSSVCLWSFLHFFSNGHLVVLLGVHQLSMKQNIEWL